jgi:polyphosphate kinase
MKKKIVNRDISWLDFNARVLQEADDASVPLIERMRFLGIFSNNLDEFFRVRYAAVKRATLVKGKGLGIKEELGGESPNKLLRNITEKVIAHQRRAQEIYEHLLEELDKEGVSVVDETNLTPGQQDFVRRYFIDKVSPSVFTIILSPDRPFPELRDKSIYLAIKLMKYDRPDEPMYALIEIPSDLIGRFIVLPKYGKHFIMYLDDLIRFNLRYIFFIFDFDHIEAYTIKITRDAEMDLDNDVTRSFMEKITRGLRDRRTGDPVRFVYDKGITQDLLQALMGRMAIDHFDSLIAGGRYHNKKDYMKFPNVAGKHLEFDRLEPLNHPDLDLERSILNVVRQKDVMLFLPYHTFSYLIRFLREAAIDPQVTEIGVTLYRLAERSRIISALVNAAKNGKKVTVVIELQARFDEEANLHWTQVLRQEGVNIIHGVPGLKVHSKIALVTRQNGDSTEYFASVGTGNFNEATSRVYTDYHLLTADKRITLEIRNLFQFFQANYQVHTYEHLVLSPFKTRTALEELINKEMAAAKKGKPAGITLKMNSLSDIELVNKLYDASKAGVKIKLIIRGICSLIPGVPGLSENIEAISVVDRFLEHSRVFVFENKGNPRYFISSADFMLRNLDHRIEVTAPIYAPHLQKQLQDHLDIIWKDNVKARLHNAEAGENTYRKIAGPRIRSQYALYEYVQKQLRRGGKV